MSTAILSATLSVDVVRKVERLVGRAMLGSLRLSSSEPAASGHHQLLATKLYAPCSLESFIPRSRLIQKLNEGLSSRLILVSAPAGSGKTSLLADWARQRPVAWLSLDPGDNDPMRFWRYVLAALDGVRPGTVERIAPSADQTASPSIDGLVTGLINDFAINPDSAEFALVLDDYHVIDSPTIHQSLTMLVEHRPPQLDLVVASRVDPPLRLARVRAGGQLIELRADDLRFNKEETAALLGRLLGPDILLADASMDTLVERTEGWAAGLRLAALALEGRTDATAFVENFSGRHRYVLDYLTEEVLEHQSDEIRMFLMETSVLERLSGELCDAVTARNDSKAMLDAIDRANLFTEPLDEFRNWWRYHQLFADLLQARLQRLQPECIEDLHRRAAGWYERNGMADDAIHHALAAGEPKWAARIIEREVDDLLLRNEEVTLDRWLAALPADVAASRPGLMLARADLELSRGHLDEVERALDAAEEAVAETPSEGAESSGDGSASLVANIPAAVAYWRAYIAELRGDAERAITFDRQSLAALGENESVLTSIVRVHLCTIELLSGEVRQVEQPLEAHFHVLQSLGEIYPALRAMELIGHVQRSRGRLDLALDTYRQGLEISTAPERAPVAAAGIAHVGLAELAYQWGDLDTALEHATEGIALCQRLSYRRPLTGGLATLARIRLAEGDRSAAFEAIDKAPQIAESVGVTSLLNPLPELRARFLLEQGELGRAVRWTKDRGLKPDDSLSYPREPEYLILARVLQAQGRFDRALDLLNRMHERAVAQGRFGTVIENRALHTVIAAAAGDETSAMASLTEALTLAQPQGYVRVFADEGQPMGELLLRFVSLQRTQPSAVRDVPLSYLGRLMRAFEPETGAGGTIARRRGVGIPGLVETLTERELEVLHLVAAGKPNRDIADELYVTVDTVKKHVSHIFEKLGASNRTEATARARDLGLLDDPISPPLVS
ncbi:MAG: LuxR C-terminal-related transcriptional regulator [Nitrolancea sp.]